MSSRNLRLNDNQRQLAPELFKTIRKDISIENMHQNLTQKGFKVDYIESMGHRLLVAAFLGDIRLIDNVPYKFNSQET
jgi:pantothenate synthetase